MSVKKGEILELVVEKTVFGGDGLSRVDGMAVFIEGAVPGDRVRALITRKKKDWAKARVTELLSPSPERVAPPCPYAGHCGGCKWQHIAYERQLHYKAEHVRESLQHIAGLTDVPVEDAFASPQIFGYRNNMEFSCADRRWLLPKDLASQGGEGRPEGQDFACGLHVPGTFDKVLDVDACLLQHETGNLILKFLKERMAASGLPAYGLKSHEGFWRFLMMRRSRAFGKFMVNIVTSQDRPDVLAPLAQELSERFPEVASVVGNVTAKRAQISSGGKETVLYGAPALSDRLGRFSFDISANSFFQTNPEQAERLYDTAAEFAGLTGSERVLDLYCGTGTISLWLAGRAREVLGVELVTDAILDARKNAARNGVKNCRFEAADSRDALNGIGFTPDVVVTDPPRSGMHPDAAARLCEMAPPVIVYVSCNPATLARDLVILSHVYRVDRVQPIDMFPHTFHVECVARLTRKDL